jgi:Cdc6-like AAA superfamily ATPase
MDKQTRYFQCGQLFTPATPINAKELFSGRLAQVSKVMDTVSRKGQHAILFGERGVGKTSLANVLGDFLQGIGTIVTARTAATVSDTFSTLWKRILNDIQIKIPSQQATMGFIPTAPEATAIPLGAHLGDVVHPDDIRRILEGLGHQIVLILIIDEIDRLKNASDTQLFADTIKTLSDYAVAATIIMVGVADSVDQLIAGHESISRNLVQIPMPRMQKSELEEIVKSRVPKLEMTIDPVALNKITSLSRGLPHYTHLIALHAARTANNEDTDEISPSHVKTAMQTAIDDAQATIKSQYNEATTSPQKENLFQEVLLACALATADEFGFFAPAAVREPLKLITKMDYEIQNYARHLKQFAEERHVLEIRGAKFQRRYRFRNPLMQPYVILRGIADDMISLESAEAN